MKLYAHEINGTLRLIFSGELDHHSARGVMRNIEELVDEHCPRTCIVDLGQLTFMDSSGIAVVLKVNKLMQDTGGRAWVENPEGQPLRVLDASGIDRVVRIYAKTR